MKNLVSKIGSVLVLCFAFSSVQAMPSGIDGTVFFTGLVSGDTPLIEDADVLTFSGVTVTGALGDYSADGIGFGTSAAFSTLTIDPFSPQGLWTIIGSSFTWTFDLDGITTITRDSGSLSLQGYGVAKSTDPMKADQDGIWSLSANQSSLFINFSSITSVPEPAMLALMGLGLLGMSRVRRKSS